jgi:hypothetical protein
VVPAYLLHHRLHAIQGVQQLHRLLRQAIQVFRRAHPHLQQTGSACGSRCRASLDERFLRAHDSELVSLRVGQDSPGLSAGLADVDPTRPEHTKAVNLLIAIRGAAGQVKGTRAS